MPPFDFAQIVDRVSSAVLFVEVIKPDGTKDIGSAFHIGDGYCVTARHVIDGNKILKIGRRDTSLKTHFTDSKPIQTTTHGDFTHAVVDEPFHHPEDKVDVSIIRLGGTIKQGFGYSASKLQPSLPLDAKVDALTEGQFLLKPTVVLGYPPIPWASDVHLVVFRGDVSAVITNRHDQQRHFVISGMARGGFSGGPVISAQGTVIGVVTDSLFESGQSFELGFMSATSGKTIFDIIQHHKLRIQSLVIPRN